MPDTDHNAIETSADQQLPADMKLCPLCGEAIKAVAIKCRYCGEDLQAFAMKQDAAIEQLLFEGRPAVIYSVAQYFWITITLGIALLVYWIRTKSVKYRITTQRIIIEEGLLTTTVNNIELYRVDDVEIEYPLPMRILGYGNLHLKTSDRDKPDLVLWGLMDAKTLFEKIRECNVRERERRGIKVWTQA